VRDVQRIGILDLRLFNTDRHAGNMLVRRPRSSPSAARLDGAALLDMQQYELVPIDHGFALPEALEPPYFEWQHWPQAMLPFGREELDYIAALDAKADVEMLRQEVPSLRVESLRVLEVCTSLLQACAAAGLTLAEIAGVATRPLIGMEEEPSELERICFNARAEVDDITDSDIEEAEGEGLLLVEESEGERGPLRRSLPAPCGSCVCCGSWLVRLLRQAASRLAVPLAPCAAPLPHSCPLNRCTADEANVVAMLSVEEECGPLDAVSPTSSGAASDTTAFKMSLSLGVSGSEASRLEDALFRWAEGRGPAYGALQLTSAPHRVAVRECSLPSAPAALCCPVLCAA
jgi:hypothetical protein